MSSIILEAKSLTKEYKQTLALDHINLQIKKGKIYGFIGQNGAGKTTFLRLVTGLAFPTSGTLSLWGNSGTEELQKQRKRIGSMIETPALFPSMTAYQNMEVQRIQRGIPDKSVIKRTLDMVGLQDTGKKSVRNFSLGMRQRGPRSVDKRLARDAFGLLYLAPRPAVGHAELFCGLAQRSEFVDKLEKLHTPPAEAFPIFALQP